MLDTATAIAQLDDFRESPARTAFSPRVGVAFPLTEKSQVFFNGGRYTMVPLYGNTYRNTGIGTVAGAADKYCAAGQVQPGTSECTPNLQPDNPTFVGNPSLRLEQAKQFEATAQVQALRAPAELLSGPMCCFRLREERMKTQQSIFMGCLRDSALSLAD